MIGNGMDVQSLALQYVQIDRAGQDQIFSAKESEYNALLKSYRAIKTKINDFRDLLNDLTDAKKLEAYSVTASEEGYANITAGANASPGEYQINIQQLARADQVSLSFASETDPMPMSGTLTLGVAGDSFTIDMSTLPAGATLSDLRDAINGSTANTGVQASLVRSNGNIQLLISSENTGSANTLTMSTDGSAAMAGIQSSIDNRTVISTAQDAIINMGENNALTLTSSSNKMENVIDGLTINLTKVHASPTDQLTFTVNQDGEATAEKLQDFVTKFNDLLSATGTTNTDSAIAKDSTAKMIGRQLKSDISGLGINKLGIEFTRSGTLTLDTETLTEFLEANPNGLTEILGGTNGVLEKLTDRLNGYVRGEGALLNTSTESIQSRMDRLQDRMERFDRRMENRLELYIDQFTQMQSIVSQLDSSFNMF